MSARYRVHDLTIEEPQIEDIVRRIYEGGLAMGNTEDTSAADAELSAGVPASVA